VVDSGLAKETLIFRDLNSRAWGNMAVMIVFFGLIPGESLLSQTGFDGRASEWGLVGDSVLSVSEDSIHRGFELVAAQGFLRVAAHFNRLLLFELWLGLEMQA
jgi:hypothetical protein